MKTFIGPLYWGLARTKGRRPTNEDTFVAQTLNYPFQQWSLFGVFDGHGGGEVSEKISDEIVTILLQQLSNCQCSQNDSAVVAAIKRTFYELD